MFHSDTTLFGQQDLTASADIVGILSECYSQCEIVGLDRDSKPSSHKNYDRNSCYLPQGLMSEKAFKEACRDARQAVGTMRNFPNASRLIRAPQHIFDAALLIPAIKDNSRVKEYVIAYWKNVIFLSDVPIVTENRGGLSCI